MNISRLRNVLAVLTLLTAPLSGGERVYQNDFKSAEVGKVPDEFLVLDGGFSVQELEGNRLLELPGSPLETFGVLFGPTEKQGIRAGARIHGTQKGRRFPVMGIGLNGAVPYRLQVAPAKKALELYRGDDLLQSVAFAWMTDSWTEFRLQLTEAKPEGGWKLEGKAWRQGTPEPQEWVVSQLIKDEPVPGRPSVWGKPFSETPIRFDDLTVEKVP